MNYKNILKADENNFKTYLPIGLVLIFISLLDVFLNSFFKINITSIKLTKTKKDPIIE